MVMAQMVRELMQDRQHNENLTVSPEEYTKWKRGFVYEDMRDLSYGQSFCLYFSVHDNILYFTSTMADADAYIRKNYVR